ncbi:MAG: recombinase family protein, partial [Actinomycetota bacterium]|nr:recombinase family protein [Actinomycetota bacterium]
MEKITSRANASAVFGPRGFGHSHDRAEVIEDEAAEIRDAARRLLGGETLSSIVRDWNRRGLRTTTGRPWRVNSLSALLIQPRLAGLHVDERHVYTPSWPPILDRETHDRLVALRNSRAVVRRPPQRSLLAGLVKCGKCRGALHFLHRHDASELYRCPAPAAGGCSGVTINAEALESHV